MTMLDLDERRPRNPTEFRSATMLDVRHPQRILEVLAMPYETPTNRVLGEDGRRITETVSRGAFGHFDLARRKIKVLRDHDWQRGIGRVVAVDLDRDDGLVAELRISQTPVGDETLELAADGVLDVSVGFSPIEQRWSVDRRSRRLDKVYLDHIALVADPAYESATVLDVRRAEMAAGPTTPNKDRVRAMLVEMDYGRSLG